MLRFKEGLETFLFFFSSFLLFSRFNLFRNCCPRTLDAVFSNTLTFYGILRWRYRCKSAVQFYDKQGRGREILEEGPKGCLGHIFSFSNHCQCLFSKEGQKINPQIIILVFHDQCSCTFWWSDQNPGKYITYPELAEKTTERSDN